MTAANFKVSNGLDVGGPLSAASGLTLTGPLLHNGAAAFTGLVSANGGLTVNGAATANSLSVIGNTTLGGPVTLTQAVSFASSASFAGLLNARGGLAVTGTSSCSGPATIGSTLNVAGAAIFSSTLNTAGSISAGDLVTCNNGINTTFINTNATVSMSNATPVVSNQLGSLGSADGQATFHLANPGGNDVALSFESSGRYGLKLGLSNGGLFTIGGWSDGTAVYRMVLDTAGNMTVKGGATASYVSSNGGINSLGTINGKGNYVLKPSTAGAQQSYIFQDVNGNNLAYLSQVNGYVFLTATASGSSNLQLTSAGNLTLNGGGSFTTTGDIQANSLSSISGLITLGTTTGNGSNAGQIAYSGGNTILYAGAASLYVSNSGHAYVTPAGGAAQLVTTNASARSLKENIVAHGEVLRTIQALPVVKFNYTKASGFDTSIRHVGFIAEEVAELVPQAYAEVEGKPSINMTKFVPDLWRGVQQLIDWNNGLERRLAAQVSRNDALEARLDALEARFKA